MAGILDESTLLMVLHDEIYEHYSEDVYEKFQELLERGDSPRMAHMLATRGAPMMGSSDRAFCEGQYRKMSRMSNPVRESMRAIAQRAGINTDGRYYVGGLGRYDDPAAWVSGKEDLINSCKKRGFDADGVVKARYADHDAPPKKAPKLAPHLVEEMCARHAKRDPKLAEKLRKDKSGRAKRDLQEKVTAIHGSKDDG